MEKKPKVKNKGKMVAFLLAAGGVVIFKLALKIGIFQAIRICLENFFA